MENLFAEFTRERQYLTNVSPATLDGYQWAWKAFEPVLTGKAQVTKTEIVQRISELTERGLSPVTINTYLRSLNAFARWARAEGRDIGLEKMPKLSEPQTVIATFSDTHVQRLAKYQPRNPSEEKAHVLACLILDTGVRIDEALSLERGDVDLDNLLLTVRSGKGRKGRVVPFSLELRRMLYRYMSRHAPRFGNLVFFAGDGVKVSPSTCRGEGVRQRHRAEDHPRRCDTAFPSPFRDCTGSPVWWLHQRVWTQNSCRCSCISQVP